MHLLYLNMVILVLRPILKDRACFRKWLVAQKKTKNDWLERINDCDFVYISHNHPDHLHPLTLKNYLIKNKFCYSKICIR